MRSVGFYPQIGFLVWFFSRLKEAYWKKIPEMKEDRERERDEFFFNLIFNIQ